ncbi:protein spdB [Streptomyces kaniharaensis]|uniref:Protein spdB n=1 Tax=Streptomyces kaniharaensis TaxID=212423 RepID=A0A6N7L678_9ACTN|nr:protein spdB [Streptomyces kaniharaensis]MQS18054.1 protein spdB [Streptomyces kaniharaensis]
MNTSLRRTAGRAWLAAPALAVTVVSAVLTVAVVALWLNGVMPLALALVIGLGYDGAWLAALSYERRLAGQGDHNAKVTALGWMSGALTTGMLVVHALTSPHTAGWLAVAWLPLAAKSLWWLHGVWESTEISPKAKSEIRRVLQDSRDNAAISRAVLNAQTHGERTRMDSLSRAGAAVAKAQSKAAERLSGAWQELAEVNGQEDQAPVLERLGAPAAPRLGSCRCGRRSPRSARPLFSPAETRRISARSPLPPRSAPRSRPAVPARRPSSFRSRPTSLPR